MKTSHLPNRKSIRLKGHDYSKKGYYFITICVNEFDCIFGEIINEEMHLNDAGKMIHQEWLDLQKRFPGIIHHEFIIMPNHFHAILEISTHSSSPGRASLVGACNCEAINPAINHIKSSSIISSSKSFQNPTLGQMIAAFKSITTVQYIRGVRRSGWKSFNKRLWHRNYWEKIIKSEKAYENIERYIINNPKKWNWDSMRKKE